MPVVVVHEQEHSRLLLAAEKKTMVTTEPRLR